MTASVNWICVSFGRVLAKCLSGYPMLRMMLFLAALLASRYIDTCPLVYLRYLCAFIRILGLQLG